MNYSEMRFSDVTLDQVLDLIDDSITTNTQRYLCVTDARGVHESTRCPRASQVRREAAAVLAGSTLLAWTGRLLGGARVPCISTRDLLLACCERSMATGYRHYFIGSSVAEPEVFAGQARHDFPGLLLAGTCLATTTGDQSNDDEDRVASINAAAPDIVWVSMPSPLQEQWIATHSTELSAPVLIGLGCPPSGLRERLVGEPLRLAGLVLTAWRRRASPRRGRVGNHTGVEAES